MFSNLTPYDQYVRTGVDWLPCRPAHWEMSRGMRFLQLVRAKNADLSETTVLSLSYGRIVVKPQDKLHGLVPASFASYQVLEPGAIVVRPTDLQNDQRSARVGLVRDHGIITSAYLGLGIIGGLTSEYAYGYLSALDSLKVFYGMGSGLRQNLEWADFKRLPMLLPPSEEQAAIVRYLAHANRRIDQAIAAKRKLIRLLEEQMRVMVNRAVVRGLDASASFEDSGVPQIGEIPVHWETAATGRLVSLVTSGSRGWAEYYSDEGPIFLQSGSLGRNLNVDLSRIQRVKLPATAEGQRTRVMQGDVLVCITGALTGNVAVLDVNLDDEAYVNQHVALLRPITGRIAPKFLGLALHSRPGKEQFKLAEYGGTKQGLGLADVRSVKLALPPLPEQRAILDYLAAENSLAETAISRTLREIDLLREFRTRLTADVVTGQVDVRGIAASLPDVSFDELAEAAEGSMDDELDELADEFAEDAALV